MIKSINIIEGQISYKQYNLQTHERVHGNAGTNYITVHLPHNRQNG